MKHKIVIGVLVAIAATGSYIGYQSTKVNAADLTPLQMANIEAISSGENTGEPDFDHGCVEGAGGCCLPNGSWYENYKGVK